MFLLFSGIISVSASIIIFSSSEVSYDNGESGMSSSNVQDTIDELYGVARLSDRMDVIEQILDTKVDWQTIYPFGSIYTSVNSKSPQILFGGTWVSFGTGRTLVGIDSSQTEFNSVEKTGGSQAHNNLQS